MSCAAPSSRQRVSLQLQQGFSIGILHRDCSCKARLTWAEHASEVRAERLALKGPKPEVITAV